MSRRVWAVWRTVASPRHVRILLYNPCSCCYSMLRSVDTWTDDLFPPTPRRRGPLAVLPENDRPSMVSAFLEVLHHALPLGLCAVNGRGHPEQGLVSLPIILIIHNWHPVLMTLPEAAHFGGAKRPVKERPLVPPLIDDCPMLKTITSRLHPPRPVVPYTTSNPVKSSSTLHVLTSANLVPCPHQPLAAWAMIKEQFTAFCLSLLPWLGPLVYRDGVTPP